jgi:hypothetical protein
MMSRVGALVTLDLPDDSPALTLPWIITFGPLDDEEAWEPVVCGPYERDHALSLAESVVADGELMAVVEPLVPHTTVDGIRNDIEASISAAEEELEDDEDEDDDGLELEIDLEDEADLPEDSDVDPDEYDDGHEVPPPPSPDELRAGFARIAARLSTA